jgi:hypothetical protein
MPAQWLMNWDDIGTSLSACSEGCAREIKAGRYRVLNEQPEPTKDPMKAQQRRLF